MHMHNKQILREIWNKIMIKIWSIILTSLVRIATLLLHSTVNSLTCVQKQPVWVDTYRATVLTQVLRCNINELSKILASD